MPIELEVNTHAELSQYYQGYRDGRLNLLGVVGRCGTGKSETARRVIGGNAVYLEGNGSPFGLFCWAQKHQNKMLVLDDLDNLSKDKTAVRVLRALTDSREVRTLRWESNAFRRDDVGDGLKREFTTTSPVCFISNSWRRIDPNSDALADRGITVRFSPSNQEIHRFVEPWFKDREVYQFIGQHLRVAPAISIRDYINASKLSQIGMDWKTILQRTWKLDLKLALVAELQAQIVLPDERLKAFLAHPQGGSRATYFRKLKELGLTIETSGDGKTVRLAVSQSQENVDVTSVPGQSQRESIHASLPTEVQTIENGSECVLAIPTTATSHDASEGNPVTGDVIYCPAGRAGEYSEYAVNLYGGCDHQCRYCFVPLVRCVKREKFYAAGATFYKNVLKKLETDCQRLQGKIHSPILLSFTSDAYQLSEADHQTTRQAIRILKKYDFRVCVLTKGGMRATRDFDLLDSRDVMAASLTLVNEADSLNWEPQAALPNDRIEFLKAAKNKGMETWASLEPVIDPKQSLELIRATRGIVDLYKIGTINYEKTVADKINWPAFINAAVAAVIDGGQAYYLKDDLFKFADPKITQIYNPHGVCIMHGEPAISNFQNELGNKTTAETDRAAA